MRNLIVTLFFFANVTLLAAEELYRNDAEGNAISGNKEALAIAAMSGRRIAVKINVNGEAVYHGNILQIHDGEVCLMTTLYAINIKKAGQFDTPKLPFSANFCTNGVEYVKHPTTIHKPNKMAMTWFAVE